MKKALLFMSLLLAFLRPAFSSAFDKMPLDSNTKFVKQELQSIYNFTQTPGVNIDELILDLESNDVNESVNNNLSREKVIIKTDLYFSQDVYDALFKLNNTGRSLFKQQVSHFISLGVFRI